MSLFIKLVKYLKWKSDYFVKKQTILSKEINFIKFGLKHKIF